MGLIERGGRGGYRREAFLNRKYVMVHQARIKETKWFTSLEARIPVERE